MSNYMFFADRPIGNYKKSDTLFILVTFILWGLGIYTLFVCSGNVGERFFNDKNYFIARQLAYSAFGLAGFILFSVIPVQTVRKFIIPITICTLILCIFALIPGIGSERKGASRWISIPHVISFQPSEIVKFTLVLYLSHLFDEHSKEYEENSKEFIYPVVALLLFVMVIFLQKDLSTGAFIFFIGISMFIITGASLMWLIPFALLAIPAIILMITLEPYRLMRVLAFFKPEEFTLTTGYQNFASERAISAGGIWGVGSGMGLEKVSGIPEVQTDYIFAAWAGSMGLIGVTFYFILLFTFAMRGFKISLNSASRFASYSAFGCTLSIALQSIINCAVVCGAAPTTGIPLPFFSYGGSSLLVTFCMCGFIVNASHCNADSIYIGRNSEKKNADDNDNIEKIEGVVVEHE